MVFSLVVNFISAMFTLIDLYQKNYVKTKCFGARLLSCIFSLIDFFVRIGECLSGALCESDLISNALAIGFTRPVLVAQEPIGVSNKDLEKLTGPICSLHLN